MTIHEFEGRGEFVEKSSGLGAGVEVIVAVVGGQAFAGAGGGKHGGTHPWVVVVCYSSPGRCCLLLVPGSLSFATRPWVGGSACHLVIMRDGMKACGVSLKGLF